MRTNRQLNLLRSLIEIPSPSGFEDDIAGFIRQELLKFLPKSKVQIDFQKNVIATIPGKTDRTVIIDAHADEIGFMVTNISDEGYISINYIGGGDNSILSARHLTILGNKGNINAVVNRKHAHLVNDEDNETIVSIADAQVDIGIRKRREVSRHVKIGDPVVYKPSFHQLVNNYYAGYGFDDKSGCFILLETIRQIVASKKKPPVNLIFTFSSQEETGTSKLRPIVREHKPDLIIEADVTFATDYGKGSDMDLEVGKCHLGKGMTLYRGLGIHEPSLNLMTNVAKNSKVKVQYQACYDNVGYTSVDMTGEAKGIRALVMGIPLRSMHTPVETINFGDLLSGTKLLTNFLLSSKLRSVIEK